MRTKLSTSIQWPDAEAALTLLSGVVQPCIVCGGTTPPPWLGRYSGQWRVHRVCGSCYHDRRDEYDRRMRAAIEGEAPYWATKAPYGHRYGAVIQRTLRRAKAVA